MKNSNKVSQSLCFLSVLFILFFHQNISAQDCMSFQDEESFDLRPCQVPVGEATSSINLFTENVRKQSDHTPYNTLAAQFPTTAICVLKTEAESLKGSAIGNTNCDKYMTGVRLILGVQAGNVTLFYQPVLFCQTSTSKFPSGNDSCIMGIYTVFSSSKYYRYNSATQTFVTITGAPGVLVNPSVTNYTNTSTGMEIKHIVNQDFIDFTAVSSDTDKNGDTRSVIYTFREIMETSTSNNSDTIKIWNNIKVMNNGAVDLNKHSLLLSGKDSNGSNSKFFSPTLRIVSQDKALVAAYANLAHLCPPNCQNLQYMISCPE